VTELERTRDAVQEGGGWLEAAVSEWYTGVSRELMGALQQMKAAAFAKASAGDGLEQLASAVGAKKSKVYAFAACYERLVEAYGEGLSTRLESSPLSPWQVVEAAHNGEIQGDVPAALDRTEERNLSTRELKAERTGGGPENMETVERGTCPHCRRDFELRNADVRTEVSG
jgi:3-methyladenine DNA glycosylase/8-oxoguanine DNA glycosylase